MNRGPTEVLSGKIKADHVKDVTVRSPVFSSRTYESLLPRKEITWVLPPGTAGAKEVLKVVMLADGFLELCASSVNLHSPIETEKAKTSCHSITIDKYSSNHTKGKAFNQRQFL